jgi:hypothetical protein
MTCELVAAGGADLAVVLDWLGVGLNCGAGRLTMGEIRRKIRIKG